MMNENKNERNEKKAAMEEIEETKLEKVAGGVLLPHLPRYDEPIIERDDDKSGGATGSW